MQKTWKHYAKALFKKQVLWLFLILSGVMNANTVAANTVKLTIENKSFDTDRVQAAHVFFANNTGPEPASLFLIPAQGETVRKNLDQLTLVTIFRNPDSWKGYLKGVPADALDGQAKVLFECTMNKTRLRGQDVRELKITVMDSACDITLSSD